jgi:hypothetical protein
MHSLTLALDGGEWSASALASGKNLSCCLEINIGAKVAQSV